MSCRNGECLEEAAHGGACIGGCARALKQAKRSNAVNGSLNNVSKTQLAIALGKVWKGVVPGDESWCEYDYQALEAALGHGVNRVVSDYE